MKKMILCLAFFLLLVTLAPCLHAAQPAAPATQADLAAQIFAPAGTAATASSADPAKAVPPAPFLPAPKLASCTFSQCVSECTDCPIPKHPFCANFTTCVCGCR